jgi:hypothetical protein
VGPLVRVHKLNGAGKACASLWIRQAELDLQHD